MAKFRQLKKSLKKRVLLQLFSPSLPFACFIFFSKELNESKKKNSIFAKEPVEATSEVHVVLVKTLKARWRRSSVWPQKHILSFNVAAT